MMLEMVVDLRSGVSRWVLIRDVALLVALNRDVVKLRNLNQVNDILYCCM